MTANPRTLEYPAVPAPARSERADRAPLLSPAPFVADPIDRKVFTWLIVALIAMYALLQNRYWVPSGDSEAYISTARDLARGYGYQFNGQPVAMYPPGWPVLMAAMMKITPYFLPLKLLAMSCMIGALLCGYWIVRRFVPPMKAAGVILLTAILSYVFQSTYWLISESLFCLVSTAALLVAFGIAENRREGWRLPLLLALCAAAVSVRWAGLIGCLPLAAILLQGQIRPRLNRQWIALALCVLVTGTTFLAWRRALRVTPEQAAAAREFGGAGEDAGGPSVANADTQVAGQYRFVTSTGKTDGYVTRLLEFGRWFSFLLWQPFRAAAGSGILNLLANGVGWIVILLIGVAAFTTAKRRQWLLSATLLYAMVLAMNWPQPNARYLVPIAFLIVLGVVLGLENLRGPRLKRFARFALIAFIIATALCNASLYAVEVAVARRGDFYKHYEAGLDQPLLSAARYLDELNLNDSEIAVSGKYTNLNRTRPSPFGLRATVLLTGKEIVSVPWKLCGPPTPRLYRYLRNNGIRYYLYQPPVSPWRIWHFRVAWWEKLRTGVTSSRDEAGWRLYRVDLDDEKLSQVDVLRSTDWPTRVPGLSASQ